MSWYDREYFQEHPGKLKYHEFLIGTLRRHGVARGPVLDLGAGTGLLVRSLVAAGYDAVGMEASADGVSRAREIGADIVEHTIESRFPFEDRSFDAITMLDVIEHLHHPGIALRESLRCLRPGGMIAVITLNAWSVARPLLGRRWAWYQDPTHVAMYSPKTLATVMTESGFELERRTAIMNFTIAGESDPRLKPLRRLARVMTLPLIGDSLLYIGRRPGE